MANFNRVILLGNVTRDIELKYTQGGTAVTEIGMAVNDRRKNQAGEWVEETTFVDVTLWGRTAEVASEYLSKGAPVLVEGRLKLDSWESEGQRRSKLRVVGERMQLLSSRGGGGGSAGGRSAGGRSGGYDESEYSQPESYSDHSQGSGQGHFSPPVGGGAPPDEEIPF